MDGWSDEREYKWSGVGGDERWHATPNEKPVGSRAAGSVMFDHVPRASPELKAATPPLLPALPLLEKPPETPRETLRGEVGTCKW